MRPPTAPYCSVFAKLFGGVRPPTAPYCSVFAKLFGGGMRPPTAPYCSVFAKLFEGGVRPPTAPYCSVFAKLFGGGVRPPTAPYCSDAGAASVLGCLIVCCLIDCSHTVVHVLLFSSILLCKQYKHYLLTICSRANRSCVI